MVVLGFELRDGRAPPRVWVAAERDGVDLPAVIVAPLALAEQAQAPAEALEPPRALESAHGRSALRRAGSTLALVVRSHGALPAVATHSSGNQLVDDAFTGAWAGRTGRALEGEMVYLRVSPVGAKADLRWSSSSLGWGSSYGGG